MISLENTIRNRLRKCRLGKHPECLREKTNTTLGLRTTAISTREKKKTHLEKRKQIYRIEKYVNFLIFCRMIQLCPKRAKWTEVAMRLAVPVPLQRAAWGAHPELSSTVSLRSARGDSDADGSFHHRILGKDREQNAVAALYQLLQSVTHPGAASWWSSLPAQHRGAERCQLPVASGLIAAGPGYHSIS